MVKFSQFDSKEAKFPTLSSHQFDMTIIFADVTSNGNSCTVTQMFYVIISSVS